MLNGVPTEKGYIEDVKYATWMNDIELATVNGLGFLFWLLLPNLRLINCPSLRSHFVPNLTIGAPVIQSLRKHTDAFLDCHLMVSNPFDYVAPFAQSGASGFTFHVEVIKDNWKDLLKSIKSAGMQAGVALRPGTSVEQIFPLVEGEEHVDMVLVMTVEPGFGGQKFMPDMMAKVNILRKRFPWLNIEVDGGIGPSTIEEAAKAGANCIVAGSSVFGSQDPAGVISLLRSKVQEAAMKGF
ncbi:hypothetical protein L7F22_029566 [Adiantum nelumboides]|nr:hypothetical protein [Adiantum nelumboides]